MENAEGPIKSTALWSIQYLRAIAAMSVVLFHQAQHYALFRLGVHGVDLFFVISGFIMVALTQDRPITSKQFILDRLSRIAPPYWVASIMVFLLALSHIQFFGASSDPRLLLKSLLFVPADRGDGNVWPTLYLGWTLNYECFFYALFAVTLLLPTRARLVCLTAVFVSAIALGAALRPQGAIASAYTNPILAEFLAGAWMGALFGIDLNRRSIRIAVPASLTIVVFLAVSAIWFPTLIFGSISAVLVCVGLVVERWGRLPAIPLLKTVGDASYAIYLFQQFAFEGVRVACRKIDVITGLHLEGHAPAKLLSIVAALAFGIVVFIAIERPLTRLVRRVVVSVAGRPTRLKAEA